jgi:hypothetical protein
MRRSCILFVLAAFTFGPALAACGQDGESPSLGDVARQSRQEKQQPDGQPGNTGAAQTANSGNAVTGPNGTSGQSSAVTSSKNSSSSTQKKPINSAIKAAVKNGQADKSAKRVFTNKDLGAAHITSDISSASTADTAATAKAEATDGKNPPEYWLSEILAQKNAIATLKSNIDQLSASIQYAPGNCVEGCVEWNQRQQEKQQQVDGMKAQLEEMQKQLEDMQENARKQGYGSSVYDP